MLVIALTACSAAAVVALGASSDDVPQRVSTAAAFVNAFAKVTAQVKTIATRVLGAERDQPPGACHGLSRVVGDQGDRQSGSSESRWEVRGAPVRTGSAVM